MDPSPYGTQGEKRKGMHTSPPKVHNLVTICHRSDILGLLQQNFQFFPRWLCLGEDGSRRRRTIWRGRARRRVLPTRRGPAAHPATGPKARGRTPLSGIPDTTVKRIFRNARFRLKMKTKFHQINVENMDRFGSEIGKNSEMFSQCACCYNCFFLVLTR